MAVLTMRRKAGPNVIDGTFCGGLLDACEALANDEALHAVLLRAEGPAFCVGADIGQMQARLDDLPVYLGELIDHAHAAVLALVALPVPVIACVQGVAAGGGFSLALACDSVIASRAAHFVVAYPQLGTSPDTGFTRSLAARVGAHRALEICLSPAPLDAGQAHRLGIANELVDDEDLDAAALSAARRLAALPRMAVVGTKALIQGDTLSALAARMRSEKEWFLRCAGTDALHDRIRSFSQRPRTTPQ
ncbi:enoyl-CoA hydratase/isomerase family protein [Variovorax paradoxus]|nr:enoyl-CoA hydratase/isomerase family protein [Variovorax paradoxus]MBT2301999.1 enoyl-CoA hydratase/isomerase family protein [Variovorax paradoxus]